MPTADTAEKYLSPGFAAPFSAGDKYKAHHSVRALKIKEVVEGQLGTAKIVFEKEGLEPWRITNERWLKFNQPQAGGYLVFFGYDEGEIDSQIAYRAAAPFEQDYSLVD
jgi:hypothetical protein